MNTKNQTFILKLCYAAMCMALCLLLPFLTGQIPQIGSMLCPMHIPVLLAGYLCGPWWGLLVGLLAPILRNLMFGMPQFPTAGIMAFELATYGLIAGLLYLKLSKKKRNIYLSLLIAMLAGRVVYGIVSALVMGVFGSGYSFALFLSGAFTGAIPGILLQIILIPILVMVLKKAKIIRE